MGSDYGLAQYARNKDTGEWELVSPAWRKGVKGENDRGGGTFPRDRCHWATKPETGRYESGRYISGKFGNLVCEGGCVNWRGQNMDEKHIITFYIDLCNTCECSFPSGERQKCNIEAENRGKEGYGGLLDGLLDCSLYICEGEGGQLVKEGDLFHPKGDCNQRICKKDGKPSDDCWTWGPNFLEPGNKNHKKTACIDCDKRHPGCMDNAGKMYRHGEMFVPKDAKVVEFVSPSRCSCNNGTVGFCSWGG